MCWLQGAPMPFPSSMRRRIRDLNLVPVVSAPVQVDPSCRYDNLPHFSHFGDRISFVGGINKPKLIQCFDSGGHCHRQLVSPPPCMLVSRADDILLWLLLQKQQASLCQLAPLPHGKLSSVHEWQLLAHGQACHAACCLCCRRKGKKIYTR